MPVRIQGQVGSMELEVKPRKRRERSKGQAEERVPMRAEKQLLKASEEGRLGTSYSSKPLCELNE